MPCAVIAPLGRPMYIPTCDKYTESILTVDRRYAQLFISMDDGCKPGSMVGIVMD